MNFGKLCQTNTLGQPIPTGGKQTELLYVTIFKKKLMFVLHI